MLRRAARLFSKTHPRSAIYAGTFDPPSSGHLDIIRRGASLCDKLYIGVATNTSKKPIFPIEQRMDLIRKITQDMPELEVVKVEGLLADFITEHKIDF